MSDLTKKSFRTSTSSNSGDSAAKPNRIRHHRLWRTQAHNPKPHIDAIVYPPSEVDYPKPPSELNLKPDTLQTKRLPFGRPFFPFEPSEFILPEFTGSEVDSPLNSTLFPSETFAQIPPTDLVPIRTLNLRSQRSSNNPKKRKGKKKRGKPWTSKQSEDFLAMTPKAKYVVLANAESKSTNKSSGTSCGGYFKVITDYKNNTPVYFRSTGKMIMMDCGKAKKLDLSNEYVLLLNDDFSWIEDPKLPKGNLKQRIRKFIKSGSGEFPFLSVIVVWAMFALLVFENGKSIFLVISNIVSIVLCHAISWFISY
ncbi:hypothetical protein JTB14_032365 [Gonioctena quinquepunctata]|nr:hypothetical protein JTB14_032365 [Gonioctena quinquepunctata]